MYIPISTGLSTDVLGAIITHVIMQAYYRIQTRTPSGAIRCLTQPLDSRRTSFQECLLDTRNNTQTFFIDEGKNRALLQVCEAKLKEMEPYGLGT